MEDPTQSRTELEANLTEYRAQLKQVEQLLLMGEHVDPEMQEVYNSLVEVIQLTEELLRGAVVAAQQQQQQGAPSATTTGLPSRDGAQRQQQQETSGAEGPGSGVIPPAVNLPSILPASVAEHIRRAQVRAALNGQAPLSWALGAKVQAVYAADGQWYDALVDSVSPSGKLIIAYEGYAEKEEVALGGVRERPESQEVYTGVAAPKRKRVEEQPDITEVPKWLAVQPEDDEKTVLKKKKLLKSYKSKIRFQKLDVATKQKQDSWQNFMQGKGTKKKTGFFTGHKKESIFSVGEGVGAKVGVTGSGKGMTAVSKLKRMDALDGAEEA